MKLRIEAEKLTETAYKVRERIGEHFPKSGLWRLAGDVVKATENAVARGEAISRPNWLLRAALIPLLIVALSGVVVIFAQQARDGNSFWLSALNFLDGTKGNIAIVMAALFFLVSLEARLKRRRVIGAIHDLRAIAHIIDLHGITKSVDRIGHATQAVVVAGQTINLDDMVRYLRHCTELLGVVSKIGQLYVQDFPDSATLSAVDQFERLATGLSSKIWQKLMILDRSRGPMASPDAKC